jgi:hypothetical protein
MRSRVHPSVSINIVTVRVRVELAHGKEAAEGQQHPAPNPLVEDTRVVPVIAKEAVAEEATAGVVEESAETEVAEEGVVEGAAAFKTRQALMVLLTPSQQRQRLGERKLLRQRSLRTADYMIVPKSTLSGRKLRLGRMELHSMKVT